MEYTKENLQELAESIYDLDAEVYAQLGSSLGRVFNRDREGCVSDMVQLMLRKDSHQLRSELALISNMARTIEDKGTRSMIMTEYNRILKEVIALPTSFASGDILDAKAAGLNALQFKARFGKDNHRIICISRTYGCGGNEIGFMLADKLKINYYDAEIFSAVLKRLQAEQDERIKDSSAYPDKANLEVAFAAPKRMTLRDHARQFSRYHGLSKRDAVFFNQSDLICDMAKKEDFIV
ncbi:MAG: cytidylate kinase family protein, partial [Clostridium sp.]